MFVFILLLIKPGCRDTRTKKGAEFILKVPEFCVCLGGGRHRCMQYSGTGATEEVWPAAVTRKEKVVG